MKTIDSQIFGEILLIDQDDEDFIVLKNLIGRYPANAFGILNKILNEDNRMLSIASDTEDEAIPT